MSKSIADAALTALVQEWRDEAVNRIGAGDVTTTDLSDYGHQRYGAALNRCADALDAALTAPQEPLQEEVCLGCGKPTATSDCGCPAGTGLRRLRQSMLNDAETFQRTDGHGERSNIAIAYAARVETVMGLCRWCDSDKSQCDQWKREGRICCPECSHGKLAAPQEPQEPTPTWRKDDRGDVVCEHGTAADVHCCNCHNGFIFDYEHVCEPAQPSVEALQQWQPIGTAPQNDEVFFWVVPKTPEESYVDTSGNPIVAKFEPYLHRGKFKTWSALSKATHWHPMLKPPVALPAVGGPPQRQENHIKGAG